MKVRKQNAKPCEKKGVDNHLYSWSCELRHICKSMSDDYSDICTKVEEELVDHNLIRYETREMTGLHVLFSGVEKSYDLDSGYIFNEDGTQYDSSNTDLTLDSHYKAINEGKYSEDEDFELIEDIIPDNTSSPLNHISSGLSYSKSKSSDIFALAPDNIYESMFLSVYKKGIFNPKYKDIPNESKSEKIKREIKEDDLHSVATLLLFEISNPKTIKKLWHRYTPRRFEKNKVIVLKTVNKNMPEWAKRLNKYWNLITDAQREAINSEYFYESFEKPTQKELARRLGISVASYQDRLEGAYKHLLKLYPEYPRHRRRNPKKEQEELKPAPLYEIINGTPVEIPIPKMRLKKVLTKDKVKVSKWAKNKEKAYINSFKENYSYLKLKEKDDQES